MQCASSGATDDQIAGFDWILNERPDVRVATILINGAYPVGDCDSADANTRAFATVIDALASRNVVTFAAAGNDASTVIWNCACVSTVISVGATYDADAGLPPTTIVRTLRRLAMLWRALAIPTGR